MAATSGVSHFQAQMTPEIPGVYRIHFANAPRLLEMLSADNSLTAQFFRTAMHGNLERASLEKNYTARLNPIQQYQEKLRQHCEANGRDFETTEVAAQFQELIAAIENEVPLFEAQLAIDNGYDVLSIKKMVHHILRIEKQVPYVMGENGLEKTPELLTDDAKNLPLPTLTPEERQHYFEILKTADFLTSPIESVISFKYQSGPVLNTLLNDNPHLDTLVLGCGRQVVSFPNRYTCSKPENALSKEHSDNALSIDRWTGIDPHVHADFYDVDTFCSIPDHRLTLISDHSNRCLIADSSETSRALFQEFYRTLQPGGKITTHRQFKEEEILLLQSVGFETIQETGTAIKPKRR